MWVKPQPWPIKSHCISQDKLGFAAITNTSPARHLRGFQQQSYMFTRVARPLWGGGCLFSTATLGTCSWRLRLAEVERKAWWAVSYLRTSVKAPHHFLSHFIGQSNSHDHTKVQVGKEV